MTILRNDIMKAARSYDGVPFLHQGRTRTGIDCIGLIWAVAHDVGYDFEMTNAYSGSPSGQKVIEDANKALVQDDRQGWDNLKVGDIIIVWGYQRNIPQHFAVIGTMHGKLTMIHAFARAGKVTEHYLIPFWKERYMGTWQFPETER
jgi:cell wall-associated NlpC family hydrolase